MAERRMISKKIIHGDEFLDLPATTQNLYFHLLLEADDEGFVNSPKRIQRTVGASDGDAQMLIAKKFILAFESGIIVIKHWRIHNYIQNDRFKKSTYTEERSKLGIKGNGAYTFSDGYILDTNCTPSIGKDRLGKDNKEKNIKKEILIPETFLNTSLIQDFINHRKELKKPFTQKALDLFIKRLEQLSAKHDTRQLIENAIISGWQTVYEPKEQKKVAGNTKSTIDRVFNKFNTIQAEVIDEIDS